MKPVSRSEVLDLGAYEQIRDRFRARVIEEKKRRRASLGPNMTVLFENHDTALYQIQEMLRTERISAEKALMHEIDTYNELVPGDLELSATIFVEYDDRTVREAMLERLAGLEDKFYVVVDGQRFPNVPDARNDRRDRTTAMHYVKFPLSPAAVSAILEQRSVKVGVDHPVYRGEVELSPSTVAALAEDFSG